MSLPASADGPSIRFFLYLNMMILSKSISADGSIRITAHILMSAPRAISVHSALIMSMSEKRPTPNVAAKNESALTTIDCTDS